MDIARELKVLLRLQADVSDVQGKLNPALDQTKTKLDDVANASRQAAAGAGELGTLIGSALGFGAVAAVLAITKEISNFGEQWRKVDAEINTASGHLNDQIGIWAELAVGVETFASSVRIAGGAVVELTKLTQQLASVQAKAATEGAGWFSKGLNALISAANFGGGGPLDAAKASEVTRIKDEITRGLNDVNILLKVNDQDSAKWINTLKTLPTGGLEQYKQALADAKTKLAALGDAQTPEQLERIKETRKQIDGLSGQVDKLTTAYGKQADSIKQSVDQTRLLNAEASGDQQAVIAEKVAKAYNDILRAKLAAHVPEAQAKQLATEQSEALRGQLQHQLDIKGATAGTAAAHRELRDTLAAEKLQLEAIANEMANIEQSPFLTIDQKNTALGQLIPAQIQQINAMIAQNKAQLAGSFFDPAQQNALQAAIQRDEARVDSLNIKLRQTAFSGQLQASLVSFVNQIGTTATQIGNVITSTLGTAISGVLNAITGAIFRTQTWAKAFAQVAQQIISNIIQIAIQWAVQRGVMALINLAFGEAEAVAVNAQAASAAAAWAPAGIAASIASYGAAAGVGQLAFISALLTGTAYASSISKAGVGAGFEMGGFTGPGGQREVAGFVHRGEYVMPASTVNRVGIGALDNIRSEGGGGRGGIAIFNFTDMRALEKAYLQSTAAKKMIIHTVNGAGGNLRT